MIDLATLAHQWQVIENTIGIGVNPNPIVPANPRRWALIFSYFVPGSPTNPAAFVARLFTSNSSIVSNIGGFFIQQWTPIVIDYHTYGGLVQLAWNAADTGGGNLVVTQIIQTADLRE
jgi:hypothetical protein